jgi:outer membrane protein assembly factor BamB
MSLRRTLMTVAVLAAVTTACSNDKSDTSSTATTTARTATTAAAPHGVAIGATKWTTSGITPVTAVVAAGGRFLVYGTRGAQLFLYGLDPATGKVAWQQPATRGETAGGIGLVVNVVGGTVAYLRPAPSGAVGEQLVGADPATGKDRWVSPAGEFDTLPEDCGDGAHICAGVASVGIFAFGADEGGRQRLDVPATSRELGVGLYDFGGRNPETFGVVLPSGKKWSATVVDVFGPKHSTDYGWDFERYPSAGTYVASVAPTDSVNEATQTVDMRKASTVGLDAETGKKLWSVPATYLACQATLFVSTNPGGAGPPLPVLCEYAGTARGDAAGNVSLSGPTSVSGFDPKTGALRWTWKSNNDVSLVDPTKPHVQVDDDSVVLPDESGARFVVNLRSGKSMPVTPTTAGWCVTTAVYTFGADDPKNPGSNEETGGNVAHPCTADGKDGGTPKLVPHGIRATVGDVVAYATPTGVTARTVK